MNSALLIASVDALVSCRDPAELANAVALLAQRLLVVSDACVLLRGAERESSNGHPAASAELAHWTAEQLGVAPQSISPESPRSPAGEPRSPARFAEAGRKLAAGISPANVELRGVVAVMLAEEPTEEQRSLLGALADLAATCAAQIERRAAADRQLQDTRALVARGLHDLCTPLNSLRLGMHLLEPALTAKDPAVAQRAHRAVDRMASLVTSMAEALGSAGSTAANNTQASAAATQH
jgi:signal transduction histidine kinase